MDVDYKLHRLLPDKKTSIIIVAKSKFYRDLQRPTIRE